MTGVAKAARSTVAANPCASTTAALSTVLALVAYLASLAGVTMPLWVAVLIAGAALSGALSFSREGIVGVWHAILYGRPGD